MVSEQPELVPSRQLAQHLASRLRELRARRGLTQDQVAQQLGCHESAVSRWESGSRFPTAEDLVALADLFRVSTDELLGRVRQYAAPGMALVDMRLLEQLEGAKTKDEFEAVVAAHPGHALWLPVPEGAVMMPVTETMRRTHAVAARFPDSKLAKQLFVPGH